jgi:hypothetical protein
MAACIMGVFGTGTGWQDVIVAAIVGGLGLWGGWQIVSQARCELRSERLPSSGLSLPRMRSLSAHWNGPTFAHGK